MSTFYTSNSIEFFFISFMFFLFSFLGILPADVVQESIGREGDLVLSLLGELDLKHGC